MGDDSSVLLEGETELCEMMKEGGAGGEGGGGGGGGASASSDIASRTGEGVNDPPVLLVP